MNAHLEHHASDAMSEAEDAPPLAASDRLLTVATEHSLEWVRAAVARGIGAKRLRAAGQAASEQQLWLRAGQVCHSRAPTRQ